MSWISLLLAASERDIVNHDGPWVLEAKGAIVSSNLCCLEKSIMYCENETWKSALSSLGVNLLSLVPSTFRSAISGSCSTIVSVVESEDSNMALSHSWRNQKGPASKIFLEV